MTPEEIEAIWKDRQNYKWGFYYCKADPRVIVPRRFKWLGWTVNCARPSAIPVLLCLFALLVVPVKMVKANGGGTVATIFTGVVGIVVVCLLSAYLSSSARRSR
jgi:hypothetical protein